MKKPKPAARVFFISFVFSNARRVLPQCNTRLRLLYSLNNRPLFYILFHLYVHLRLANNKEKQNKNKVNHHNFQVQMCCTKFKNSPIDSTAKMKTIMIYKHLI